MKKRGWKSRERGHPDEMSIIWIWDLDFGSRTVVLIGLFFHILPHFAATLDPFPFSSLCRLPSYLFDSVSVSASAFLHNFKFCTDMM